MASRWGRRSNATPAADRCPTGRAVDTLHTMKDSSLTSIRTRWMAGISACLCQEDAKASCCVRDEGGPFLRQDKSRKGERECDLKPFGVPKVEAVGWARTS